MQLRHIINKFYHKRYNSLLVGFAFMAFQFTLRAQVNFENWSNKPFSNLGFIENNGRFDEIDGNEIYYYSKQYPYTFFISNTCIIVGRQDELDEGAYHEYIEKLEHREQVEPIPWQYFTLQFSNANTNSFVLPQNKLHHTINVQNKLNLNQTEKSVTFEKLIISNLYPDIDLHLQLHNEGGIKYTFILHPGGKVSDIKMNYINASITNNALGGLEINTPFENFKDHAPTTFKSSKIGLDDNFTNAEKLKSSFVVIDSTVVTFYVEPYDSANTIIIDPWLQTTLSFTTLQDAYDIGYDNSGNCYILGEKGDEVAKYSSTGVLEWVWAAGNTAFMYGDLATKPQTDEVYFLGAFPNQITRLNAAGTVTANYNIGTQSDDPMENWRLQYNPLTDKLHIGDGEPTSNAPVISTITSDLTSMTNYPIFPTVVNDAKDVALLEVDPDGTAIYFLIAASIPPSPFDNTLYKVDQANPMTILWQTYSAHNFIEIGSVLYSWLPGVLFPNGYNGIVCGKDSLLYTYDGNKLKQWNKNTGIPIDSVFLNRTPFAHGGIDIDLCGNVYVGTNDSILIFDANLQSQGGYVIPNSCFDLVINKTILYACGRDFVTQIDLNTIDSNLTFQMTPEDCGLCNGAVSVDTLLNCPGYFFQNVVWSPSGANTLSVSNLCSGWQTATITWTDAFGDSIILTDSVEVTSTGNAVAVNTNFTNESCSGSCNGTITLTPTTGSPPYIFSVGGQTNATGNFTNLCAGNYPILVTDNNGCTFTTTINIITLNALNVSVISQNSPTCYGFNDGSITVQGSSGTPPYIYTWLPANPVPGASFNNLTAGIYTVVVSDNNLCSDTLSINLTQPDSLYATLSLSNPICYSDSTGIAWVDSVYNAQGNTNTISFFWNPDVAGINGLGADSSYGMYAGNYVLTINDDFGCSYSTTFQLTQPDSLYLIEFGFDPAYCRLFSYQTGNGVVYAAATGGSPDYNYLWTNLIDNSTSINTTWGGLNPGNYQITVTDDNGCVITNTIYLDSLNPIAAFSVLSNQLDQNHEGTEIVYAAFINESQNFANPNNPSADTTFFWNLNQGFSNWFISHNIADLIDTSYNGEQIYNVCLVAINNNGCSDTACKKIIVHDFPDLVAPNIFTPNGDGKNEVFTFQYLATAIQDFHCVIVNRWGVKIAELNSITDFWDGTDSNQSLCTAGVYFYTYEAVATNGSTFIGQGTVQLIRND